METTTPTQVCTECNAEKELTSENWNRNAQMATGFLKKCKPCFRKIRMDKYYYGKRKGTFDSTKKRDDWT